jgi:hypothetical protein
LRSTQNNFMSVWLNYHATRMRLSRELGIMQLDEEGRWIDEPIDEILQQMPEEIAVPPPLPSQWLEALGPEPTPAVPSEAATQIETAAYGQMAPPPPVHIQQLPPDVIQAGMTLGGGGSPAERR